MNPEDAIQAVSPARIEEASGVEDYCHLVAEAASQNRPVVDYGTSCRGVGHAPPADHIQIRPPAGVIEHAANDLYVRVAGGTRLGDLQEALGAEGQHLPIDGLAPHLTVAEIIAHNLYGPRRLGGGSMRDLLLGLTCLNGSAEPVAVGGRTVKNVAGYDLTRLMVGSFNCMGLIAEATVRTQRLPDATRTICLHGEGAGTWDRHMTDLICGDARPDGLSARASENRMDLWLNYDGSQQNLRFRLEAIRRWTPRTLGPDVHVAEAEPPPRPPLPLLMRLAVHPARTLQAAAALAKKLTATDIEALPATGTLWVRGPMPDDPTAETMNRTALEQIEPEGWLIWWNRPPGPGSMAPFAPPQQDWDLVRQLQQAMDPANLFNPGRYP
ncbi:MAG: FAD-binding oxidoreductase [Phycisphaeraceae bacterium]|nr:FAD-binding oxidoreductase [Phycisphaeraceae bacterium]